MKVRTLTNQKIWPMQKFLADKQTDKRADGQTDGFYRCGGIKIEYQMKERTMFTGPLNSTVDDLFQNIVMLM